MKVLFLIQDYEFDIFRVFSIICVIFVVIKACFNYDGTCSQCI